MLPEYDEVRAQMRPGDLIAFSGKGRISNVIKAVTRSRVSHVGTILRTQSIDENRSRYFNFLIESTSLGAGRAGVKIVRLSTRLKMYEGEVWWLPLHDHVRERFDQSAFTSWLMAQEGKPYDYLQAAGSALDLLPDMREDLERMFCSELVAEAYERSGAIGPVNASEMHPIQVVRLPLYSACVQIGGEPGMSLL